MKKSLLFLLFLLFSLIHLMGQSYFRVTTIQNKTYVYLQDIATYYYGSIQSLGDSKSRLIVNKAHVEIEADRKYILVNGIRAYLSYPVVSQDHHLLISKIDVVNLLDSLLRIRAVAPQNNELKTIVIDAGHGGKDQGGRGARLIEKDFNLTLSKALKIQLEKKGYQVFLTRNEDIFVDLKQRALFAKKKGADLFISIHANTAERSKAASGIETFHLTPYKGSSFTGKEKSSKELAHRFNRQNAKLAYEIQKQLIHITKREDRGVKYQNFSVLRNATFPAVLLELGFLSNFNEESQLMTNNEQNLIILAIVNAVILYHRSL